MMLPNISELQVMSPLSHPNYSFMFDVEQNFDKNVKQRWMKDHWHHSIYYSCVYLVVIFGGQAYMRSRKRFELQRLLTVWNLSLAVFSIVGFYRTLPELSYVLKEFGFTYSLCNPSFIEDDKVSGLWTWYFALSKVPELCDTVFLVLRKQPLIYLHWYHHITVLIFTWYSYKEHIAVARWYIVMNYFAHSLMYSYFTARALRIKLPKFVAMFITTSQILQMIGGCFVTYYSGIKYHSGENCAMKEDIVTYGVIMYTSYFVLFVQFFIKTYFLRKKVD